MTRKCAVSAGICASHMARLVASEFDSISGGASSGPSRAIRKLRPATLILSIMLSSRHALVHRDAVITAREALTRGSFAGWVARLRAASADLRHAFDETWRGMQITRGLALGGNVVPHAPDLLRRDPHRPRDIVGGYAVIEPVETQIHLVGGQGEVELLLRLGQRPGIGGRRARADLPRYAEMIGELIDLRFVEMRDRLDVGGAVAVIDEEALIVFQPVRRTDHGEVQPVGMVVFDLLAGALFHVGGGHDAEIDLRRQAVA